MTEPIVDGRIQHKIEQNREKHQLNIDRQMSAPSVETVLVFVRIQHYVRHILASYAQLQQQQHHQSTIMLASTSPSRSGSRNDDLCAISSVGIAFFHEIVNNMTEFAEAFPPANELLGEVIITILTIAIFPAVLIGKLMCSCQFIRDE